MKFNKFVFCVAILMQSFPQMAYSIEIMPENSWLEEVIEMVTEKQSNKKCPNTNSGPKKPDPENEQPEG